MKKEEGKMRKLVERGIKKKIESIDDGGVFERKEETERAHGGRARMALPITKNKQRTEGFSDLHK